MKKKLTNYPSKIMLIVSLLFYLWSLISPADYFIWFLETFPIPIGLALIFISRRNFPLSNFLYNVILIHMIILSIGGHYTYAKVPLFDYFKEVFNLSRNNFDKIGHLFQGITPTLLTREVILRKTNLKNNNLIAIFSCSVALSFSALYEIFEWAVAISTNSGIDFVSMQGDVWDTQKDMLFALLGSITIVVFFRKIHDHSLRNCLNREV